MSWKPIAPPHQHPILFIKKAGFTGIVDSVSSGEEALQMLRQHLYVLVLMDFNMPNATGAEITQQIRSGSVGPSDQQLFSNRTVPIVGVTAASNMRGMCLQAGMNEVIYKPFTQSTIEAVLRTFEVLR